MRSLVVLVLALGTVACSLEPRRSVECLAPANPGGGWDLTCRTASQVMNEQGIVSEPIRVRNMPGAGGGVAFAHAVADRTRDPNVVIAASPATTLRLAERQFGRFEADDVRWLAAVAGDYGAIAVRDDAPWRDLGELLAQWRRAPAEIVAAGGSAVGGQDHMRLLLVAEKAGIPPKAVRYVPFDGGGEALTALMGGFVDVVPADASEILSLLRAGRVRVLAVLSPSRLDAPFDAVPTAAEQGFDVEWLTWRGFYAPPGITDEDYARWVGAFERLAASDEWTLLCRKHALVPFARTGRAFEDLVMEQVSDFRRLTASLGLTP